jgi:ABC-type phosphate transport system substrate-binding protein
MRRGKLAALVPLIGAAFVLVAALGAPAQATRSAVAGPAAKSTAASRTARPAAVSSPSPPASASQSFTPLNGFGSSWAGPAIDQWARDVASQGIVINFDPDGSAAGRQEYMLNQADFAASDIAFLTTPDPFQGGTENPPYAYSYIPIVAGGTSFMYNLQVGGKKITNLRLSGETLMKIFTGQITNWDNPAITADYGEQLPSLPITVIVRADGSGASYQFSDWILHEFPSDWQRFCAASGGPKTNCGPTEFYPDSALPNAKSLNGSDLVANYIGSPSNNGAIGYDEYAYALDSHIPVVAMQNAAGYDVLPSASNVAIALQKAVINEDPSSVDYLMQNLDSVYGYNDPRTYPLSSYSYIIVPRTSRVVNGSTLGPPPIFNTSKGYTLSTWLKYVLCGAQQTAGALGYSPLPYPLVTGGFLQFDQIPGHIASIPNSQLDNCDNPTYDNGVNLLIKTAPYPSPCAFHTAPLNCTVKGGKAVASTAAGSASTGSAGTGSAGTSSGGKGNGSGNSSINPNTGAVTGGDTSDDPGAAINASPVSLSGPAPQEAWVFAVLIVLALLGAIAAPTVLGSWLERRRTADSSAGPGDTAPRPAGPPSQPRRRR